MSGKTICFYFSKKKKSHIFQDTGFLMHARLGVFCEFCPSPVQWAFWPGSPGSGADLWELLGRQIPEDSEGCMQPSWPGQEQRGARGGDPPGCPTSKHCGSQRCF